MPSTGTGIKLGKNITECIETSQDQEVRLACRIAGHAAVAAELADQSLEDKVTRLNREKPLGTIIAVGSSERFVLRDGEWVLERATDFDSCLGSAGAVVEFRVFDRASLVRGQSEPEPNAEERKEICVVIERIPATRGAHRHNVKSTTCIPTSKLEGPVYELDV